VAHSKVDAPSRDPEGVMGDNLNLNLALALTKSGGGGGNEGGGRFVSGCSFRFNMGVKRCLHINEY
jgi:hypothetical protein